MGKKVLSAVLALAMVVTSVAPAYASTGLIQDTSEPEEKLEYSSNEFEIAPLPEDEEKPEEDKLEISPLPEEENSEEIVDEVPKLEVAEMRSNLQQAVRAVRGIEPENEKEREVLTKYNEAVYELDTQINLYESSLNRPAGSVQGIEEIIDVQTIPARIQLMIRIGRAIRFGTTDLSNKVVAAHTKLTEYILVGILYVLNPFASNDQIMEYINSWEPLEQELLSFPDLQPHDIATIYKKAGVSREVREANKVRRSAMRGYKNFSAKYLQKVIADTNSMLFRITVTCGELDEQVEVLHEAMERITGPKIRVERIEFMEGTTGYIHVDERTRIRPVVFPDEVKNKDVILYSSNSYVARVSGGEIVPIKPGSVKIMAVSLDNAVKKSFDLIITEPGAVLTGVPKLISTGHNAVDPNHTDGENSTIKPLPVAKMEKVITSINFNVRDIKIDLDETYSLKEVTLPLPTDAVNKTLEYAVEDESIAKISDEGVVTPLKAGSTKLVAQSESGAINGINLTIVDKNHTDDYEISSIDLTDKVAGVFRVQVKASKNGAAYTGPAKLTISSGDRTIDKDFYFERGIAEIKFTGFDFGVWRKDFKGTVKVGNIEKQFEQIIK